MDYVSTLTKYTVDELDALVMGKAGEAIDFLAENGAKRREIWQAVGATSGPDLQGIFLF